MHTCTWEITIANSNCFHPTHLHMWRTFMKRKFDWRKCESVRVVISCVAWINHGYALHHGMSGFKTFSMAILAETCYEISINLMLTQINPFPSILVAFDLCESGVTHPVPTHTILIWLQDFRQIPSISTIARFSYLIAQNFHEIVGWRTSQWCIL